MTPPTWCDQLTPVQIEELQRADTERATINNRLGFREVGAATQAPRYCDCNSVVTSPQSKGSFEWS